MIKLLPEEQKTLSQYVYSISALALDDSKGYLLEGRLSGLAEEMGCRSFGELVSRAQSDPGGPIRRRVIDAITTGETFFFRDTGPFDLLRCKILPELIDRRTRSGGVRSIRIWSAACSTGQELYSIAIVLKEMLGDPARYGVRLLGTDISNEAVARASRGIFNPTEISRGMGEAMRAKYFVPAAGGWQIRDEIRAMASFRTLNLMQDFSALGRFDIVFCRNVAIYFNEADKRRLFGRLAAMLEPHGGLIIGATESITGLCPELQPLRYLRSVFYGLTSPAIRVA